MIVHRGRAFARAWPAEPGEPTGKAALVGVLEVDRPLPDDQIHGMAILPGEGGLTATATGAVVVPKCDHTDQDVDALLRGASWPRPSAGTGIDGGGIAVRATRAPAAAGRACVIMIALFSTDLVYDQTMLDIRGDVPGVLEISGATCARHLGTNGQTLAQVLKRPIWGWGREPWGLHSTMGLAVQDACRRLDEIALGDPERHDGERDRLERGAAGGILRTGRTDDLYQRFRRRWNELHGPAAWNAVLTASQLAEHEQRAERIVRELMQEAA